MSENQSTDDESKNYDVNLSDEEIVRIARERFSLAVDAEEQNRKESLIDLKFLTGDHWPTDVKNAREQDRRPCLTINRIPQFVKQITNEQRQNRPSIRVSPVDDKADLETAKVIQGHIRHIEYNSNADIAYDTAFECAVGRGFGFFRIVTDFCDPMSFDQEILIKRIRNPLSVYIDPSSSEPDGSDMNWAFVTEDMSRDEYLAKYKDSKIDKNADWKSLGNSFEGWFTEKSIRIAEYFYKTFEEIEIVKLNNGQILKKTDIHEAFPAGIEIKETRKSLFPVVKWVKINGLEIIEKTDWPGQWIPIIPVFGEEIDVEGQRRLEGIIRHARDSQMAINFWRSSEAETIALAPKAPFIVAEGQLEGYEEQWKSANIKNHTFLMYKPVSVAGQPVGAPQRNAYEPPIQAITNASIQATEDLKATTGIYDATLGNRSNETSGVAIQRRNAQAQTSNFHFIDNLSRSLRHAGRIIIDILPSVYDTKRSLRIIGEDDQESVVAINQMFQKEGKEVVHRFDIGKYDVTVDTGPSYATKRQEAVQSILSFIQAYPPAAQVSGDLLVKNMDWPGSKEIAERLKKSLPPGIADDKDQAPIPPQVQQQLQQQGQMIDQLTQHLNEKTELLKNKTVELESKERIEFAKLEQQAAMKLAELQSREATTILAHQMQELTQRLNMVKINEPIEDEVTESQQQPNQFNNQGSGSNGAANFGNQQQQPTGGQSPGLNS